MTASSDFKKGVSEFSIYIARKSNCGYNFACNRGVAQSG